MLVMMNYHRSLYYAVWIVVGHAVAVVVVGTVVVEAVGTFDAVVVDVVVVVDTVRGVHLMLLGCIADSARIAAVGRLHYLVVVAVDDKGVVDNLRHTTKCNVSHLGVLYITLCSNYTHLDAGNGCNLGKVPNPIACASSP